MTLLNLQTEVRELSDPVIAEHSARFFKTGKGDYGEGDQFLGIRVPHLRQLARKYRSEAMKDVLQVLKSPFHEERLLALFMMVDRFKRTKDNDLKTEIYQSYLNHTDYINNWDLVDSSAYHIAGVYLFDKNRDALDALSLSRNLWERRIAIIATLHFIRHEQYDDTLRISHNLIQDSEDLIHKAVGWMIREVGNRDRSAQNKFLAQHYKTMPRTMLRYAIEKYDEHERRQLLRGEWRPPSV